VTEEGQRHRCRCSPSTHRVRSGRLEGARGCDKGLRRRDGEQGPAKRGGTGAVAGGREISQFPPKMQTYIACHNHVDGRGDSPRNIARATHRAPHAPLPCEYPAHRSPSPTPPSSSVPASELHLETLYLVQVQLGSGAFVRRECEDTKTTGLDSFQPRQCPLGI